jgi:hypothetical protein
MIQHRTLSIETLTGTGDLYDRAECFGPAVDYVVHVHWRDERRGHLRELRALAIDGRVSGVLDDRRVVYGAQFDLWLEDGRRIECVFSDEFYFRGTRFLP